MRSMIRSILTTGLGGGLFVAGLGLAFTGIGLIAGFPMMFVGMALIEGAND